MKNGLNPIKNRGIISPKNRHGKFPRFLPPEILVESGLKPICKWAVLAKDSRHHGLISANQEGVL